MRAWILVLLLSLSMALRLHPAFGQGWSEPTFTPDLMTAPLTPPPVTGSTFYVDKTNIGGTCNNSFTTTQAQNPTTPWCDLSKAFSTLTAGQRALVRGGTHNIGAGNPANAGTPGNYITFQANPGDPQPFINCSGNNWCFEGQTSPKSYIVINGFEIANPQLQYMVCKSSAGCHHWWFVNNKIHNNGLAVGKYDGFVMPSHHIVLSNNELYNTTGEGFITLAGTETGNNIILEFNHVHDNGRDTDDAGGLKCGDVDAWNCIMRYNIVHDNYRNPSSSQPCFNDQVVNCQGISGLYIDRGRDNEFGGMSYIYNNIVYNNDIGIQVFDAHGARVFNNLVYHNGFTPGVSYPFVWHFQAGIATGGSATNVQILNNTVVGNAGQGIDLWDVNQSGIILRNNLVQGNGKAELYAFGGTTNADSNFNLFADPGGGVLFDWNGSTYTSLAAFKARSGNTMEANSVATAASFVNQASNDYHLQAGSAGLNVGQNQALYTYALENTTRPAGAWDLGAYERVAAVGNPPVATITAPNSGNNTSVTTTPLTTLAGTATDSDGTVASVTVACSPSCGSPTVTGPLSSWSVATLPLTLGPNVITVTATDNDSNTATDTITVTLLATQLRIDAGGNGGTFSDGTYQADAFFSGGTALDRPGQAIAGTTDDALYASERYGTMTYTLPLQNGTYTVILKFAEMNATAIGQRLFNVDIQGTRVLTNFDIFALVGANTALDQSFTATVSTGALTIALTTVADNAEVVGIAAVPLVITQAPVVLRLVK